MRTHPGIGSAELRTLIRKGEIRFAGNRRLKIYGTLDCRSGKRMAAANRVFFPTENEAILEGYRPCGHCMKEAYAKWTEAIGILCVSAGLQ